MNRVLLLLAFVITSLIGCNQDGSPVISFLNTDNLTAQLYHINLERDTVLRTQQGADIYIGKEAINANGAKFVLLEVKEAYRIEDILKAGLQTKSGSKILSSGGMIYINVKDNNANIVQPIKVSLPSNNVEPSMKLFKGEIDEKGNVDWQSPQPLLTNKTWDSIALGKSIFQSNCISCHDPTKDATGPPLVFLSQRRDKKWLKQFISNPAKLIADGDVLANCLYEQWNRTAMTGSNYSDDELNSLLLYLDQESKKLNPKDYPDIQVSLDSCTVYLKAKQQLQKQLAVQIADNGKEVEHVMLDSGYHDLITDKNLVVPKNSNSTYYQFTINTFGWYNVDVFTEELPGFVPSNLVVNLEGPYNQESNVYLIVPDAKICVDGGLLKGEDFRYGFYEDNGKVPLPQGRLAHILVFTEHGDKITFAQSSFTTGTNNELTLKPRIISKEEINQKIKSLNFDNISFEAKDTKNASQIKSLDSALRDIENLKPASSNCECHHITGDFEGLAIDSVMTQ